MANYIQPGTENPTPNPLVTVRSTPNGNPLAISRDGTKEENYQQPDYRPVTVDPAVGVQPMFNGVVVGEK
jgi:hypothetical protein